jgi:hypothetical protein
MPSSGGHCFSVAVSTKYLTMKFPIVKRVAAVKGNQEALRKCANTCQKGNKALLVDHLQDLQGSDLSHVRHSYHLKLYHC